MIYYIGGIMKIIKEAEFNEITSKGVVLVDFFATWCGPCRMLGPILEEVEATSEEKFKIVKVDVDECSNLARKFGIMSIPTMIIFKDGTEVEKIVGLRDKDNILETISAWL